MTTIATRDQLLLDELSRLGRRHIDDAPGQLVMLDADPDRYPAQHGSRVRGTPQPPVVIEGVAVLAEPRFAQLVDALRAAEANSGALSATAKVLARGENVILVTNHASLIDIALAEAALVCALSHLEATFNTAIVISKVVSMIGITLGTEMLAAADALTMLCDDVFLSFPRTKEVAASSLASTLPRDIEMHNTSVKDQVDAQLSLGSMLLAMAPSGSVDRAYDDDPSTICLERLHHGTMNWMARRDTAVLPIAIWLRDAEPVFEVVRGPRRITTERDAHEMMAEMAATLNRRVASFGFRYEGSDELTTR